MLFLFQEHKISSRDPANESTSLEKCLVSAPHVRHTGDAPRPTLHPDNEFPLLPSSV